MNNYLYKITNLVSGKYYVGMRSTKKPVENDSYLGSGLALKAALDKHGREAFKKEILVICPNREYLADLERKYVDASLVEDKNCYNIKVGGEGGSAQGIKRSEETRAKLSDALKGRKLSQETRTKLSAANTGKKQSRETIEKISAAQQKLTEEQVFDILTRLEAGESQRKIAKDYCAGQATIYNIKHGKTFQFKQALEKYNACH